MSRVASAALDAAAQIIADAIETPVKREPIGAQDAEADDDDVALVAALSEGQGAEIGFLFGAAKPHEFEHAAAFELLAVGGDESQRRARLEAALEAAEAAILADPTLGGVVDYAELTEADPSAEPRYAGLVAQLSLTYSAPTALG